MGWLETKALIDIKLKPQLTGTWQWENLGANAKLKITAKNSSYTVKGSASTPNGGGSVSFGDVDGKIELVNNAVFYKNEECEFVGLWLNGFLSVVDNNNCGGVNLSFTGVFKLVK